MNLRNRRRLKSCRNFADSAPSPRSMITGNPFPRSLITTSRPSTVPSSHKYGISMQYKVMGGNITVADVDSSKLFDVTNDIIEKQQQMATAHEHRFKYGTSCTHIVQTVPVGILHVLVNRYTSMVIWLKIVTQRLRLNLQIEEQTTNYLDLQRETTGDFGASKLF